MVNAGVSGDTAAAGLARLDWALPDNASAVIIELGANDALQGLPPEGTKQALEQDHRDGAGEGAADPARRHGGAAQHGQGLCRPVPRDLCRSRRALHVIFYPFFLEGAALNDGMMQGDGMHPNAKGVAAIVENILPKVEELLAEVKAKQ